MDELKEFEIFCKTIGKKSKVNNCLFCGNMHAINSHAISKRFLKKVAIDGNVYTVFRGENFPNLKLQKLHINKASTQTNFCSKCDNELFEILDNEDFDNSQNKLFLLAFRSISSQLHTHKEIFKAMSNFKVIGKNIDKYKLYIQQMKLFEAQTVFDTMKQNLLSKNYSSMNNNIIVLNFASNFIYSGCFPIMYDLYGRKIFDVENANLSPIFFNVFSEKNKTYIIISWQNDCQSKEYQKWFVHVDNMSLHNKLNYLSKLAILNSENIYFNPQKYEKYNTDIKELLGKFIKINHCWKIEDIYEFINCNMVFNIFEDEFDYRLTLLF